jgi:hypothetical protein
MSPQASTPTARSDIGDVKGDEVGAAVNHHR